MFYCFSPSDLLNKQGSQVLIYRGKVIFLTNKDQMFCFEKQNQILWYIKSLEPAADFLPSVISSCSWQKLKTVKSSSLGNFPQHCLPNAEYNRVVKHDTEKMSH